MGKQESRKKAGLSNQQMERPMWKILLGNVLLGHVKKPTQWFSITGKPNCVCCGALLGINELLETGTIQSCLPCREAVEEEIGKKGKWIWRDILKDTITKSKQGKDRVQLLNPLLDLMDEAHAEAMFSVIVDRQSPLRAQLKGTTVKARVKN